MMDVTEVIKMFTSVIISMITRVKMSVFTIRENPHMSLNLNLCLEMQFISNLNLISMNMSLNIL